MSATACELLAHVAAASRAGAGPEQAWQQWSFDGCPSVELDAKGAPLLERCLPPGAHPALAAEVAAAAHLAHGIGVPLAQVLDHLVDLERMRSGVEGVLQAAQAGPQASQKLLRWLPLFGFGLSVVVEPRVLALMFASPMGWILIGIGTALTVTGSWWTSRLVKAAVTAGQVA